MTHFQPVRPEEQSARGGPGQGRAVEEDVAEKTVAFKKTRKK